MNYIIACAPRCGSTLLSSAFSLHPQLNCAWEILNPYLDGQYQNEFLKSFKPLNWVNSSEWREEAFLYLYGKKQEEMTTTCASGRILDYKRFNLNLFLDKVFLDYAGFKAIYSHIDENSYLMDKINSLDVKIIYLNRNLLDSCISFKLAKISKTWQTSAELNFNEKITLTVKDVEWYCKSFDKINIWKEKIKNNFLDISYTELINNWDNTIDKIQIFLNVDRMKLPMILNKINNKNNIDLIVDYRKFKKELYNSSYSYLLRGKL